MAKVIWTDDRGGHFFPKIGKPKNGDVVTLDEATAKKCERDKLCKPYKEKVVKSIDKKEG